MAQLVRVRKAKEDRAPRVMMLQPLVTGAKEQLLLGRTPDCDFVFRSTADGRGALFSRHHAVMRYQNGAFIIEDVSVNGTFVNQRRIKSHVLQQGDELGFGAGGDIPVGDLLPSEPVIVYRFLTSSDGVPSPRTLSPSPMPVTPGRRSVQLSSAVEVIPALSVVNEADHADAQSINPMSSLPPPARTTPAQLHIDGPPTFEDTTAVGGAADPVLSAVSVDLLDRAGSTNSQPAFKEIMETPQRPRGVQSSSAEILGPTLSQLPELTSPIPIPAPRQVFVADTQDEAPLWRPASTHAPLEQNGARFPELPAPEPRPPLTLSIQPDAFDEPAEKEEPKALVKSTRDSPPGEKRERASLPPSASVAASLNEAFAFSDDDGTKSKPKSRGRKSTAPKPKPKAKTEPTFKNESPPHSNRRASSPPPPAPLAPVGLPVSPAPEAAQPSSPGRPRRRLTNNGRTVSASTAVQPDPEAAAPVTRSTAKRRRVLADGDERLPPVGTSDAFPPTVDEAVAVLADEYPSISPDRRVRLSEARPPQSAGTLVQNTLEPAKPAAVALPPAPAAAPTALGSSLQLPHKPAVSTEANQEPQPACPSADQYPVPSQSQQFDSIIEPIVCPEIPPPLAPPLAPPSAPRTTTPPPEVEVAGNHLAPVPKPRPDFDSPDRPLARPRLKLKVSPKEGKPAEAGPGLMDLDDVPTIFVGRRRLTLSAANTVRRPPESQVVEEDILVCSQGSRNGASDAEEEDILGGRSEVGAADWYDAGCDGAGYQEEVPSNPTVPGRAASHAVSAPPNKPTTKAGTKAMPKPKPSTGTKAVSKPVLKEPRTAFQIFYHEQKEHIFKEEGRQPTVSELRTQINLRWAMLLPDERSDYQQKEERERELFHRLHPRQQAGEGGASPTKQRPKHRLAPPRGDGTKKPAKPPPINKSNEHYRKQLSHLVEQQKRQVRVELKRLREEEARLHGEKAPEEVLRALPQSRLAEADDSTEPEEESPGKDRPKPAKRRRVDPGTDAALAAAAQTAQMSDEAIRNFPVSRRILNVGRKTGEQPELLPTTLAALLKRHQLEGVQFMWRNTVMNAALPQLPEASQRVDAGAENPPAEMLDEVAGGEAPKHVSTKGCILGHAMGLGKTLTTITFCLSYLDLRKGRTILIIAPKSTILNWRREIQVWCTASRLPVPRLWVMDDRVKTAERLPMVREWAQQGGIMVMGFAVYVNLVGERALRATPEVKKEKKKAEGGGEDPDEAKIAGVNSDDEEEERQITADAAEAAKPNLTTTELRKLLNEQAPDCIVVDEGHKLTNPRSCLTRALNRVVTQQRIILTGTPIQNNLWEYFTMINFIRPGYWDKEEFRHLYITAMRRPAAANQRGPAAKDKESVEARSEELYRDLVKFVHRKDVDVLQAELPPKHEFVVHVALGSMQKQLYTSYLAAALKGLQGPVATKKVMGLSPVLARICSHPDLVWDFCIGKGVRRDAVPRPGEEEFVPTQERGKLTGNDGKDYSWASPVFQPDYCQRELQHSNKMKVLFELINQIMVEKEKVLVFSQWTAVLDQVEHLLRFLPPPTPVEGQEELYDAADVDEDDGSWKYGRDYFRLDGECGNAKRQFMVDHFNDPVSTSRLFLISTRAGGLGVNLTGATRVILFDSCWNPQADQQAIYRTYRYGQRRPVFVYRLLTEGTVEEAVFQKVHSKAHLFRRLVDDPDVKWSRRDLESLRAFGVGGTKGKASTPEVAIEREALEADSLLARVCELQEGIVTGARVHSTRVLISDDDERLTQASQLI